MQQAFRNGIADQLFHRVAHRTRSQLRVKTFAHEKRQNCFIQFQFVSALPQEFDFTRQEFLRNFQLMLVTQTTEHEFFIHARENFRAQGLLCPRQDVAFQRRVIGMLEAHQFRRADV